MKPIRHTIQLIIMVLLMSVRISYAARITNFNVKDYGAAGDGINLDSKAINKAIDAASAAGGGTVYLPAGNYLSGSIHLKSNISLFIDQGATIIAAPVSAANGYDEEEASVNTIYQDSGHSHWHNSLIWGENLHDVSILGQGQIWGKGLYKDYVKDKQSANKAIALYLCRNVNIRDISVLHGGWFAILVTGVDNLTIDNVILDTNRDGMDIDCCRNVHVSNCSVNSPYDDGICLKSTFGLGFARATENVTITNCAVSGFDEGSFLGGTYKRTVSLHWKDGPVGRIKFGTESNGGFKNITISNCTFNYCRGLALETVDGALLEDVTITNITMRDIVNAPIFLRIGSRMRGPAEVPVGELRRVIISNIIAYNVEPWQGVLISGIPNHPIKDITLKDIKLYFKGTGTDQQAKLDVPELEKGYPEPSSFGTLPAYGFFVRHVESLTLENIELNFLNDDQRPAFVFDDVKDANLRFVKAQTSGSIPPISMKNTENITVFQSLNLPDGKLSNKQ
ncbi:polygalacturonase [Mucilaginibacter frigoritolerans]|uniref:Polygalacturonase n=1 Tax=Mucilaginibacter frigoritolerans TaxID=652788 RepID=A0A562U9A0_9SPHI|nr:glycoside hydrolase family 28 protein [Mucilaginibacter frigoritolerans]TWJ02338.1 polygalacturonase [Mucilaginibacter frigoritolerans]